MRRSDTRELVSQLTSPTYHDEEGGGQVRHHTALVIDDEIEMEVLVFIYSVSSEGYLVLDVQASCFYLISRNSQPHRRLHPTRYHFLELYILSRQVLIRPRQFSTPFHLN